jgi:hypothetical protein
MKSIQAWSIASGLALLALGVGCGGENGANNGSASDGVVDPQTEALARHARRQGRPVSAPPAVASAVDAGAPPSAAASGGATSVPNAAATAGASAAPAASAPGDVSSIIAAAQTPDGTAIPQPAGPGGQCPPVVVALGFWSCPTMGEACSYTGHQCSCVRTDGEGQYPAWVCN